LKAKSRGVRAPRLHFAADFNPEKSHFESPVQRPVVAERVSVSLNLGRETSDGFRYGVFLSIQFAPFRDDFPIA
jgi:hypothetical protein